MARMWFSVCFTFCYLWVIGESSVEWALVPEIPASRRAEYFLLHEDGGYKYGLDTGTGIFAKQTGTAHNEVEGHYGHVVDGKVVDVKYTAGVGGFVPEASATTREFYLPPGGGQTINPDGSYSFAYSAGDSSRQESGDSSGNVQGRYAYQNEAGHHDLSYKAGDGIGFVPTGGSLATPNGLGGSRSSVLPVSSSLGSIPPTYSDSSAVNPDGSYKFSYSTGDSQRSESSDASGNVRGHYSYRNHAGHHDLSYKAGPEIGFVPTGGSLAIPNGLPGSKSLTPSSDYLPSTGATSSGSGTLNKDGSYSFSYSTGKSEHSESGDANGNVQGQYSYNDNAGHHDLSYKAGPEIGFVPTGGSLAVPNGLGPSQSPSSPAGYLPPKVSSSTGSGVTNPDASYEFSYSTGDSERRESGDANGNVQGQYSYTNEAGHHDLSYKAGAETGFVPTGGSLAVPNGLQGSKTSTPSNDYSTQTDWTPSGSGTLNKDGSYSFSYSTGKSEHSETGDANGNVQGQYSYNDNAGHHDLSYKAGPEIGFVPTGGSLAVPNGLQGEPAVAINPGSNSPSQSLPLLNHRGKTHRSFDGLVAVDILPIEENRKVGYILH